MFPLSRNVEKMLNILLGAYHVLDDNPWIIAFCVVLPNRSRNPYTRVGTPSQHRAQSTPARTPTFGGDNRTRRTKIDVWGWVSPFRPRRYSVRFPGRHLHTLPTRVGISEAEASVPILDSSLVSMSRARPGICCRNIEKIKKKKKIDELVVCTRNDERSSTLYAISSRYELIYENEQHQPPHVIYYKLQ